MIFSINRIYAIALSTFREAVRNRVLAVLVMFAVALIGFSLVLGSLSLHEEVRLVKDLGLMGISVFGVIMALFLGVNLLAKELEKKTVYAIVPKPLHRWEFLLGKYCGLIVTMALIVGLMASVLALLVEFQGGRHGTLMLRAELLIFLELALLISVAILFSSFSSPYLSAMFTGSCWVIGRNMAELEVFIESKFAESGVLEPVMAALSVIPDFRMFYISGAELSGEYVSVHENLVPWAYVGYAAGYAAGFSALCLGIAMLLFARRDFI